MIRKLRIKIVLVIVLVAAVMLGVIFGMSYTMTRQDLRAQSLSMMQAIAANPFEPIPPGQSRQVRLPYFVLRTDAFGNLVAIGSTDYDLTDRSFLRAVAAAASASEADIGEIPAYHLRFCRVDGSVIFADISSEQQTLQGLVRSSLLIGGGSLLALIGLAILLARWAVRPVETAWRQQKQFVADASHELKTPLTVILTNTELLQSPDYDEAQKQQFTDGIRTMAQQMRALVERLLELARAENARPQAAFAPVCLSEVAETSALLFEAALYARADARDAGGAGADGKRRRAAARPARGDPARQRPQIRLRRHRPAAAAAQRAAQLPSFARKRGPGPLAAAAAGDLQALHPRRPGPDAQRELRSGARHRAGDRAGASREDLGREPGRAQHVPRGAAAAGRPRKTPRNE